MPLKLSDAAKQAALSALDLLVAGVAAATKPASPPPESAGDAPSEPSPPAALPAGVWVGPTGALADVKLQELPFSEADLQRVLADIDAAISTDTASTALLQTLRLALEVVKR